METPLHFYWKKWLVVSNIIGDVISTVVMGIFYFTLFVIPSFYYTWVADEMGRWGEETSFFQDFPLDSETGGHIEEM